MERLAYTLALKPSETMQAFAEAAVALCEADGAGVSLRCYAADGASSYCWGATAGIYAYALRAMLPATMEACGSYLEQGMPQHYRTLPTSLPERSGVPVVTDGVLIPWAEDDLHGILWMTAHGRAEAFDLVDARHMEVLGSFIAIYLASHRDGGRASDTGRPLTGGQLATLIGELLDLRLGPPPPAAARVLPFRV